MCLRDDLSLSRQLIYSLFVCVHLHMPAETAVGAESLGTLRTLKLFSTAMRFQVFL